MSRMFNVAVLAAALSSAEAASPHLHGAFAAGRMPTRVGQCVSTRIKQIANRLENAPGSGSAVLFTNGGYPVSYDQVPAVDRSRRGDPVRMCLVALPQGCPKGDDRGKIYKTTNRRTDASWRLPDSEHSCGGA